MIYSPTPCLPYPFSDSFSDILDCKNKACFQRFSFYSRSFGNIGLAGKILDEFFCFRLSIHCSLNKMHILDEEVKNIVKKDKKKNE